MTKRVVCLASKIPRQSAPALERLGQGESQGQRLDWVKMHVVDSAIRLSEGRELAAAARQIRGIRRPKHVATGAEPNPSYPDCASVSSSGHAGMVP